MKTKEIRKQALKYIAVLIVVLLAIEIKAQNEGIGINETGALPDISAMLDISSTTKGALIPRVTTAARNSLASPAESLLLFNTDVKCWQIYINGEWKNMFCDQNCSVAPAAVSSITGNNTVSSGSTGEAYSVAVISGATSYTWTVPPGASITSGQGSISITVDFGSSSGDICVVTNNNCGSSSSYCYSITVN